MSHMTHIGMHNIHLEKIYVFNLKLFTSMADWAVCWRRHISRSSELIGKES